MSKLIKHSNRFVTISIRFKNPWRKHYKTLPPDEERCTAITQAGTRCRNPNERSWGATGEHCGQHRPRSATPRPNLTPEPTDEGELPENPAEWLASLGDAS